MYSNPFYTYNQPSYSYSPFYSPQQPAYPYSFRSAADEQAAAQRAQALAAQRARRHQYLPDEDEDSGDEWEYSQLGPRERAYVDAQRKRAILERMQRQREEEESQRQQQEVERRWQQQLDRRQKEAEAERAQLLEQKRRAQRQRQQAQQIHQAQERSRSRSPTYVPINIKRSPSHESSSSGPAVYPQSPARSIPITEPQSPQGKSASKPASVPKQEPPRPQYEERHHEAASRIQQQYRIYRSYHTIQDVERQFEGLKQGFTWPSTLDFQIPGSEEGHITVPASSTDISGGDSEPEPMDVDGTEGKLAYTSANYAFHQYTDLLEKLLVKLDGVESWGDKKVRERRRHVVKSIEMETQKLDRYWRDAWRRHLNDEKSKSQEAKPETETEIETETETEEKPAEETEEKDATN